MAITITGISDTHSLHERVNPPLADILVVAGDFCNYGIESEVIKFNRWLKDLKHKYKIVIAGNHDRYCQNNREMVKMLLTHAIYLDTESVQIMGINFFGMPWTPEFCEWAFMYPKEGDQGKNLWDSVPETTNIIISHGPPSETKLGWTKEAIYGPPEDAGCALQRKRIMELPNLKATFCGHIHCGAGMEDIGKVKCMNVSVVNEQYQVVRHGIKYQYPSKA